MHVILAAEWDQEDRERDGRVLLRALGLAPSVQPRLLRDEGEARMGIVLRARRPIALIELFFAERGNTMYDGRPDPISEKLREREEHIAEQLQQLLGRLPPPAPPPPRRLEPGEHDFSPQGLCRLCGESTTTLAACGATKGGESPARDRFELIELD
jgi:hypothetical protein